MGNRRAGTHAGAWDSMGLKRNVCDLHRCDSPGVRNDDIPDHVRAVFSLLASAPPLEHSHSPAPVLVVPYVGVSVDLSKELPGSRNICRAEKADDDVSPGNGVEIEVRIDAAGHGKVGCRISGMQHDDSWHSRLHGKSAGRTLDEHSLNQNACIVKTKPDLERQ